MRVAAFPPGAAFLPALARAWLAKGGAPEAGVLILPNRRAALALAGAFLHANGGRALLLPRMIALGAIDEAGLRLRAGLDLPPAVPVMTRQAMLAKLILARGGAHGAPHKLHTAWALAADLAGLLDEAAEAEIDLAAALPGVVAAELAHHWRTTLEFLEIVTHAWPAILSENGWMDPAARLRALLDAQAAEWAARAPGEPVWLVARDATPAQGRLARVVAGCSTGMVILPGFDTQMDDAAWEVVEDGHPQMGIARLLGAMGVRREEVLRWPAEGPAMGVPAARAALLSRALLPARALGQWQDAAGLDAAGVFRLSAADEQADATAIAMVLREALEVPGRSAALVTPDRAQAVRVAAALRRFGILADDSAGDDLATSPPAAFLRLLAQAAAVGFAPLPLLALLQHPLAAAGLAPEICRDAARGLELAALRGPRPEAGFSGILFRLETARQPGLQHRGLQDFVARLERILAPIAGLPVAVDPADGLRALLEAGEALAATEALPGAARLWDGEAGTALSEILAEAMVALETVIDIDGGDLPALLDAVLAGHVVRRPRTRDGHPRVAIWGVREASLQTVDVLVLGGLVEGVWPAAAEPGPWLSRPMRHAAGLPAAERNIGEAAHDFWALGCRSEVLVLAAPRRRERAPAVPARWLTRLDALLAGAGTALAEHPAGVWAADLDMPAQREIREKPTPRPPAAARPEVLSVSDIATLLADPYAIYARRVLRIRELPALDEETDPSLFGTIVHAGLQRFFSVERDFAAVGAVAELVVTLQVAMREYRPRPALAQWWAARLARIAGWIVDAECERRWAGAPVAIALEAEGLLRLGRFGLKGRADRIEKRGDGSVMVMDYKTGTVPSAKAVRLGSAPQLPLEAWMAEAGAFGPDMAGVVTELAYWKLAGRNLPGEETRPFGDAAALRAVIDQAATSVPALFERFGRTETAYLAAPHPGRTLFADVYGGISRRLEWGGGGNDAE